MDHSREKRMTEQHAIRLADNKSCPIRRREFARVQINLRPAFA